MIHRFNRLADSSPEQLDVPSRVKYIFRARRAVVTPSLERVLIFLAVYAYFILQQPVRYIFPLEPTSGPIDLTADEMPFYFNEYSGELSLEFPKAERHFRGGILAYAQLSVSSLFSLTESLCRDGNVSVPFAFQ